ncbi:MAG: hypothetical protein KC643_31345 [Nitrospira sp.]|nr:hypothetical protein [Nitrospira sp.]
MQLSVIAQWVASLFLSVGISSLLAYSPAMALQAGVMEEDPSPEFNPGSVVGNPFIPSPIQITWRMENRFGVDADQDGIIDVPNTYEYANVKDTGCPSQPEEKRKCEEIPPGFVVYFDSVGSRLHDHSFDPPEEIAITEYLWSIRGIKDEKTFRTPKFGVRLQQGRYTVQLTVKGINEDGRKISRTKMEPITIRDIVFVALGDSFSSGEGNPEQRKLSLVEIFRLSPPHSENINVAEMTSAHWAETGPKWNPTISKNRDHARAHRSTLGWPAQVALTLERSDPHTSVTFIYLAATGATIREGIIGPHQGALDEVPGFLKPQLQETQEILRGRSVDILTMSIGGNDAGFSSLITALLKTVGTDRQLGRREKATKNGKWDEILEAFWWTGGKDVNADGLDRLPSLFNTLAEKINSILQPRHTYILGYPDLTQYRVDGHILTCDHIGDDVLKVRFNKKIDDEEAAWARDHFIRPLNQVIRHAASRHGWRYVEDRAQWMTPRGYCGRPLYSIEEYTGHQFIASGLFPLSRRQFDSIVNREELHSPRWWRTAKESVRIQGVEPSEDVGITPDTVETTGMFHPNEMGHQALTHLMIQAMPEWFER